MGAWPALPVGHWQRHRPVSHERTATTAWRQRCARRCEAVHKRQHLRRWRLRTAQCGGALADQRYDRWGRWRGRRDSQAAGHSRGAAATDGPVGEAERVSGRGAGRRRDPVREQACWCSSAEADLHARRQTRAHGQRRAPHAWEVRQGAPCKCSAAAERCRARSVRSAPADAVVRGGGPAVFCSARFKYGLMPLVARVKTTTARGHSGLEAAWSVCHVHRALQAAPPCPHQPSRSLRRWQRHDWLPWRRGTVVVRAFPFLVFFAGRWSWPRACNTGSRGPRHDWCQKVCMVFVRFPLISVWLSIACYTTFLSVCTIIVWHPLVSVWPSFVCIWFPLLLYGYRLVFLIPVRFTLRLHIMFFWLPLMYVRFPLDYCPAFCKFVWYWLDLLWCMYASYMFVGLSFGVLWFLDGFSLMLVLFQIW